MWLLLVAYTCSGFAGLVYEVSWTRLLTLYIGHTTAAASTVVGAFLGGLALGAAAGGRLVARLERRRSLQTYAALEAGVALLALLVPFALAAMTPLLRWAYQDGTPNAFFPIVRLLSALVTVFVPALALGATYPAAVRWFADDPRAPWWSSVLYALNTAGAMVGALLAGFVLIPAIGVSGTTWIAVAASIAAAASALTLARRRDTAPVTPAVTAATPSRSRGKRSRTVSSSPIASPDPPPASWVPLVLVALTGLASLTHEIVWTRVLALVLGPSIYAFSAALALVVAGVALGSSVGAWLVSRVTRPLWLAGVAIALASVITAVTAALAGTMVPRWMAQHAANGADDFAGQLWSGLALAAGLMAPTSVCLGAMFPFALALVPRGVGDLTTAFGQVYASNTIGSVLGSLAAGFVFIPLLGLQGTMVAVVTALVVAAGVVVFASGLRSRTGLVAAAAAIAALVVLAASPAWDRALLVSGAYLYAPFVPKDLDLEAQLRAGTLLYYREGAAATVSVKRLTGTTTLAVDGKVDASNRGDMLTQKLIAHLPLLLHDRPDDVAIVGLGSGVTLGAALTHPVQRADVLEIAPEIVEASAYFESENHRALADPRVRLIVGDGRSHVLLSQRRYDVIISEPSNPWIAGVSALFTREFFVGVRAHLTPGGVFCQWANAYNISDADLRSIAATFHAVFPDGTMWLVGGDDVLFLASDGLLDERLANIARHWTRPGVEGDLAEVLAMTPFSLLSLFIGGPSELAEYARGAELLTDDRMRLEFSSPRQLRGGRGGENSATLAALLGESDGPPVVATATRMATAADWRQRAAMMAKADVHEEAYRDDIQALTMDPHDATALTALVQAAVLARRVPAALEWVKGWAGERADDPAVLVAMSQLLAAAGETSEALKTATRAAAGERPPLAALEQLATLHGDEGDAAALARMVERMRAVDADAAATEYFAAVLAFLHDDAASAVQIGERVRQRHPAYGAVYDLLGAAYTRTEQVERARDAFSASLALNPHDSTAYTNLGLLDLSAGRYDAAANAFAEALWLDAASTVAREGLARARAGG